LSRRRSTRLPMRTAKFPSPTARRSPAFQNTVKVGVDYAPYRQGKVGRHSRGVRPGHHRQREWRISPIGLCGVGLHTSYQVGKQMQVYEHEISSIKVLHHRRAVRRDSFPNAAPNRPIHGFGPSRPFAIYGGADHALNIGWPMPRILIAAAVQQVDADASCHKVHAKSRSTLMKLTNSKRGVCVLLRFLLCRRSPSRALRRPSRRQPSNPRS
jgi:hypothetical protein